MGRFDRNQPTLFRSLLERIVRSPANPQRIPLDYEDDDPLDLNQKCQMMAPTLAMCIEEQQKNHSEEEEEDPFGNTSDGHGKCDNHDNDKEQVEQGENSMTDSNIATSSDSTNSTLPTTLKQANPLASPSSPASTLKTLAIEYGGGCRVAEQGVFRKHTPNTLTRLKSSFVLKAKRLAVFTSPEFKRRLYEDNGVPKDRDATASTFGLLRSTLDPQYRDRELGNVWEYTDGCKTKEEVRDVLTTQAVKNYDRDMKRGRFARGQSKLKFVVNRSPKSPPPMDGSPSSGPVVSTSDSDEPSQAHPLGSVSPTRANPIDTSDGPSSRKRRRSRSSHSPLRQVQTSTDILSNDDHQSTMTKPKRQKRQQQPVAQPPLDGPSSERPTRQAAKRARSAMTDQAPQKKRRVSDSDVSAKKENAKMKIDNRKKTSTATKTTSHSRPTKGSTTMKNQKASKATTKATSKATPTTTNNKAKRSSIRKPHGKPRQTFTVQPQPRAIKRAGASKKKEATRPSASSARAEPFAVGLRRSSRLRRA